MMKLYYADVFSPRKTCAAARHLGAPVELVPVDLGKGEHKTAAYRALNPNAKVPVLVDGDKVIWESNAIMCYLSDKAGSDFWPRDGRQVELVRWLSWDAQHFARHGGDLYFEHVIRPAFGLGGPDAKVVEQARAQFRTLAEILDQHLDGREVVVGDGFTAADFALGAVLPWAEESRLPIEGLRNLARWRDGLESLDAWRNPYRWQAAQAA